MSKLLIIAACLIAGETIARHADVGEEVDVPKDDALSLCRQGRALYLDKSEDPTKGTLTADSEKKSQVKKQAKAIADELAAREAKADAASPQSIGAQIAAGIAEGMAMIAKAQQAQAKA